jgi:hypothetical protein
MIDNRRTRSALRAKSHMPETLFYEKIVPALLIVMGVVMFVLILLALAVVFGFANL